MRPVTGEAVRYFTGKPCKRGHIAERYVRDRMCVECHRAAKQKWIKANREKDRARQRAWLALNRERVNEQRKAYRHRELVENAARRAFKLQATPPWVDMEAIKAVYAEAERLTRETGTPHEVDHIIPLQHPMVCGLHVHTNLRAIPASENRAKGNRWEAV